ncbi:hypothetical protein EV122DRAFT_189019, partial [Schizophyllum commune]
TRNLPTKRARPAEIGIWIKSWRVVNYEPKLPKDPDDRAAYITKFKDDMRLWWSRLNPAWRTRKDGLLIDRNGTGSWDALDHSGINGLQSLLKGLHWWFAFEEKPSGSLAWLEIVRDVAWALREMKK